MKTRFHELAQDQAMRRLSRLDSLRDHEPPSAGWIRYIREALGMSTIQMAKRVGVKQSSITAWEKRERSGAISLNSLRKVAASMECDLVYALVPRKPLNKILETRAREVAAQLVDKVDHTMSLENQGTSTSFKQRRIADEAGRLLRESPRKIWG